MAAAPDLRFPSIDGLRAFEATARNGRVTLAAEELHVTHSAVSRQLKALQDQIGVALLRREGKGLALTPAGTDYAASIRDYLQDLARASLKIRAAGERSEVLVTHGHRVVPIRYLAVVIGGMFAGLGGAHLSIAYANSWFENMVQGRGFVAVAVIFVLGIQGFILALVGEYLARVRNVVEQRPLYRVERELPPPLDPR